MVHKFIPMAALLVSAAAWAQDSSGMASGILDHSRMASQAVAAHDKQAALDHISQAMALANTIQQHASPDVRPVMVPVYAESDTTTTYRPVKGHNPEEMSPDRLKKHTSVREVEGQVTNVSLNVSTAAEHLSAAQAAVQREDWTSAKASLEAIPQAVIGVKLQGSLPLLKARDNLVLAKARLTEQKYGAAKAPLRAAAQALREFQIGMPGPHEQQAESIRVAIEALADHVDHHHDTALEQVNSWLDPVNQWLQNMP